VSGHRVPTAPHCRDMGVLKPGCWDAHPCGVRVPEQTRGGAGAVPGAAPVPSHGAAAPALLPALPRVVHGDGVSPGKDHGHGLAQVTGDAGSGRHV